MTSSIDIFALFVFFITTFSFCSSVSLFSYLIVPYIRSTYNPTRSTGGCYLNPASTVSFLLLSGNVPLNGISRTLPHLAEAGNRSLFRINEQNSIVASASVSYAPRFFLSLRETVKTVRMRERGNETTRCH